jgi:hypothetical protein
MIKLSSEFAGLFLIMSGIFTEFLLVYIFLFYIDFFFGIKLRCLTLSLKGSLPRFISHVAKLSITSPGNILGKVPVYINLREKWPKYKKTWDFKGKEK